ncbi:MAG: hypothetical protein OEY49_19505, partial [Candidatus Heimdallarchaeota archaeon]|nr:hypothetical protein [Candidatus Heimdallarchaeota archaeon]
SEDEISIFRYDPDGNTDITSVLLISCVPGSDLELIKGIGSIAIKKSRANPEIIGRELSLGLREQFKSKLNYKTKSKENKLKMLYKGQPDMPLNNTVIKGIISIDFNTNTADFRNFSSWIDGIEILPEQFLNFIDLQLESIIPNKITSFIYKGIQLIGTTTENCKFFVFIHLSNLNVIALKKISEWFVAYVDILSKLGKFSSTNDIKRSLNLLNDAQNRDTEIKYFQNYLRMVLKGNKIYPAIIHENSFEIELPNYINKDSWNFLKNMDGAKSLNELLDHTESSSIDIITMIEWCRVRNLMNLLEK